MTVQSTAHTSTPAFAASRKASPKAGWVVSLGRMAVTPSIWMSEPLAEVLCMIPWEKE